MGFTCEIKFPNHPNGIFLSGQTLTGTFELHLDKLTKVKCIWLCVRGIAKCKWTTGSGDNRYNYSDKEYYFQSNATLLSSDVSGEPATIAMGIQTYAFGCDLPQLLPSSFEGNFGHIRYDVSVTVERPWKLDRKILANFSVINQYDLNTSDPILRHPYENEITKTFCCWPCQNGEVIIRVNLPRTAYIPGEQMPIEMYVKNDSDVRIVKMKFCINKTIYYRTFNHRKGEKIEQTKLLKMDYFGIDSFTTKQIKMNLVIPSTTPTNTGFGKIINIEYNLLVKARTSCGHKNIPISIPLVIGTIPFRELTLNDNSQPITTQPMLQSIPQPPPIPPHHIGFIAQQPAESSLTQFNNANIDPLAPPPSYEEIVNEQQSIK